MLKNDLRELYKNKIIDKDYLERAVIRGWITALDFSKITNEEVKHERI